MINIVPTTVVVVGIQYSYCIRGDNNNTIVNDTSLTSMDVLLVYSGGSSVFDDEDDEEEDDNTTRMPLCYEDVVVFIAPTVLLGTTTIDVSVLSYPRLLLGNTMMTITRRIILQAQEKKTSRA